MIVFAKIQYPVAAIFGPTLQGEGHFTGYRVVFVRLAGCNVGACHIRAECDEAPWKATETLSHFQVVERVRALSDGGIVVVSGGEPSIYDLRPLIDALTSAGFRIHLETSGENDLTGIPIEWLTVSPKTRSYRQRTGHVLKVVIRPDMSWQDVRALDQATTFFHRYLQPLTQLDGTTNLAQVIEMLLSEENAAGRWALSTQAHKVWGVR